MIPKIRFGAEKGCQCSACGAVFSTIGNFDKHRHGFTCRSPYAVGFAPLRTKTYETDQGPIEFAVFGTPMDAELRESFA